MDRVDVVGGRILRVVDYKTGRRVYLPKKMDMGELVGQFSNYSMDAVVELKDGVRSLQLPVYLVLAKENYVYNEFQTYLVLLGISESKIFKGFSCDADEIEKFRALISFVIDHIVNSQKFYAIPGEHCQYCEYVDFCRFSKI